MTARTAILATALLLSGRAVAAEAAPDAENCLACHGSADAGGPVVDAAGFAASRHAPSACVGCHSDIKEYPHPAKVAKVDCASCHYDAQKAISSGVHAGVFGARKNGTANACTSCHGSHTTQSPAKLGLSLCAKCHKKEVAEYKGSVHGKANKLGDPDAAICLSCHGGGHSIRKVADPLSSVSPQNLPETCAKCHSDPELSRRHGLSTKDMYKAYMNSTHAKPSKTGAHAADCASCHGSHDIRPPSDPASRIAIGNIVKTCGQCHGVEAKQFSESIHGHASARGVRSAPTCIDCHGEHDIRGHETQGSRVARGQRSNDCVECHQSARVIGRGVPADRVGSFLSSFHGMAGKSGDAKVADCVSCHGWHDVQPSTFTTSRTNPANLAQTCGQCHPGAGARWAGGTKIHQALSDTGGGSDLAGWAALFYRITIPLTVLGMVLHNLLDLWRKMRSPRARRHREDEVPLSVNERWQHAVNAAAFLLLAYSGFALHYPDAWWAWPFTALGGETARRYAHRSAAALFMVVGGAHMAYLATAMGRRRLFAMLPAKRDLFDPLKVLAYNAGVSPKKPVLAQFSYAEKFEYWALIWGSLVMTVTGALLLMHNMAMAYLPLWAIEVARVVHYLEAVLACLAILIWHGYWVALDPDVYPLNWAWLTGETYLHEDGKHDDKEH
ncbi:MAG: cytochrome c3 family protein [Elusimicrobiota bacterium]|nr:cytochrome c3 family protein [Elusimicrobiota bacterium]